MTNEIKDRFWSKVTTGDGCWNWKACIGNVGYGVMNVNGNAIRAHRISVILSGRIIPNGMHVDHLCRNRKCVRPDHLEVVTPKENNLRSGSPSANNSTKTKCINGHDFFPENTYHRKDVPGRQCKACCADRKRNDSKIRRWPKKLGLTCAGCGVIFSLPWEIKFRKYCTRKCGFKTRIKRFMDRHPGYRMAA